MAFVQDITLGQYFPGESLIHRLDPRSKLVVLLVLILIIEDLIPVWAVEFIRDM